MADHQKSIDFLKDIGEFYQPEYPEEKKGIGHEVEHVKGVMRRMMQISKLMQEHPEIYGEQHLAGTKELTLAVAALHDIGNTINRDMHNHLGAGIIRGELTVEQILSTPIQVKGKFLTEDEKQHVIDYINSDGQMALSRQENNAVIYVVQVQTAFQIGYHGPADFNKETTENIEPADVANYVKEHYSYLAERSVEDVTKNLFKNGHLDDITHNPGLQGITEALKDAFTPDEIETIAEAVQDHNIDFVAPNVRYEARSIYGMMVADADKDNVSETFALRTLAFAINKWPQKNSYFLKEEDGKEVPDPEKCATHIMDQAWERFRKPLVEGSEEEKKQEIPENILRYKKIDKIKGIVSGDAAVKEYKQTHEAATVHYLGEGENKIPYIIKQDWGDDVYSQIDAKYEGATTSTPEIGSVMKLRDKFMEEAQLWVDVEEGRLSANELPENLKLSSILSTFETAFSIEAAVDVGEEEHYDVDDNRWDTIIDELLAEGDTHGGNDGQKASHGAQGDGSREIPPNLTAKGTVKTEGKYTGSLFVRVWDRIGNAARSAIDAVRNALSRQDGQEQTVPASGNLHQDASTVRTEEATKSEEEQIREALEQLPPEVTGPEEMCALAGMIVNGLPQETIRTVLENREALGASGIAALGEAVISLKCEGKNLDGMIALVSDAVTQRGRESETLMNGLRQMDPATVEKALKDVPTAGDTQEADAPAFSSLSEDFEEENLGFDT